MAECIGCGKKFGRLETGNFNGKICDKCYGELGAYLIIGLGQSRDLSHYTQCINEIIQRIENRPISENNKIILKEFFYNKIEEKYKSITGEETEELVSDYKKEIEREKQEAIQKTIEVENKKKNYANSFNEFYEYDVVTIINENHGTVDKIKMMQILSEYSRNGWKLHTIYSNELGKNALKILGFGTNSTACEDVMIFERRIPELD